MGAICAVVYLLTIIIFIPFPFYKDIVAATSGGGNRDVVVPIQEVEMGRSLHRFPHSKVLPFKAQTNECQGLITRLIAAGSLSLCNTLPTVCGSPGHW